MSVCGPNTSNKLPKTLCQVNHYLGAIGSVEIKVVIIILPFLKVLLHIWNAIINYLCNCHECGLHCMLVVILVMLFWTSPTIWWTLTRWLLFFHHDPQKLYILKELLLYNQSSHVCGILITDHICLVYGNILGEMLAVEFVTRRRWYAACLCIVWRWLVK
jgi:hypothetical protein